MASKPALPDALPYWVIAVVIGGLIGSWFGAQRLNLDTMRLALVPLIARLKTVL